MNTEIITAAAHATLTGEKPFPEIVGMLIEAGVEFYQVDYLALRKTYFGRQGDQHMEWFPGAKP